MSKNHKSITNNYNEINKISKEYNSDLFNVNYLQIEYYKSINKNAELKEEISELKFQLKDAEENLKKFKEDDSLCLIDISKKMNKILKNNGEKEMIHALMLERAKVIDHFTLAYLADTSSKISEIKLVQGTDESTGMFEMYFEKKSSIILL